MKKAKDHLSTLIQFSIKTIPKEDWKYFTKNIHKQNKHNKKKVQTNKQVKLTLKLSTMIIYKFKLHPNEKRHH